MTVPVPIPDSRRDLLSAPGVAVLTTFGPDEYPQSTAIWYLLDGDLVRTSLWMGRQKFRNLRRHPRATLFLLDPTNPYRTVELRCDVSWDDDDAELSFLQRLLRNYGQELETFPGPKEDRVVVTLTPHHIVAYG